MASCDPQNTYTVEQSGLKFEVQEQKGRGQRQIFKTLKAVTKATDGEEVVDLLITELARVTTATAEIIEESLSVKEMIELLQKVASGSALSGDERKKSE